MIKSIAFCKIKCDRIFTGAGLLFKIEFPVACRSEAKMTIHLI